MTRLPRWAWWLTAGPLAGGIVVGGLGGALFLVDSWIRGEGVDLAIAPYAVVIAGFWGVVGGFASGCFCAAITWGLERRRDDVAERTYAFVAGSVTFGLALPFSVLLAGVEPGPGLWDLAVWVLIPVTVSTAAAWLIGLSIWQRTHATALLPRRALKSRPVRIMAVATLVLGAFAFLGVWLLLDDIGVDEREMALTKDHLRTLARGFDSVSDPPNARGRAAKVGGCSTDSGDLFQPDAYREWRVSKDDADAVAMGVARRLAELGWRNAPEFSANAHPDFPLPSEPVTPDRFGAYTLSFEANGWSAVATVAPSFEKDSVFVEAEIKDATPCFWKDEPE